MDVSLYMAYYGYLWALSWPMCCGLFLLVCFLGIRIRQRYKVCLQSKRRGTAWAGWGCFIGLAVLVAAIYGNMLIVSYPDWKHRPQVCQGQIVEKELAAGQCRLTVDEAQNVRMFFLDREVFDQVKQGDRVKIGYLADRGNVFLCEVLKEDQGHILEE